MENTEVFELDEGELRLTEPPVSVLRTRAPERVWLETVESLEGMMPSLEPPKDSEHDDWGQDVRAYQEMLETGLGPISVASSWLARRFRQHLRREWVVGFVYTFDGDALPSWATLVLKQLDIPKPSPLFCQFLASALDEIAEGSGFFEGGDYDNYSPDGRAGFIWADRRFELMEWLQELPGWGGDHDRYPELAMLGHAMLPNAPVEKVRKFASEQQRLHAHSPEEYFAYYEQVWGNTDDGHYAYVAMDFEVDLIQRLAVMLYDIGRHCELEFIPAEDEKEAV